jgi:lipoprotein-releasing system ATP-binding protein|tara:strand:+ start:1214 stop:1897 length:684 start_codon:yes stop_codon:yes gene_type:complete
MTNILEIINLSKKYDQNKNLNVLKNLNFKFKKGKIYSLIGPSGSGKSTLLNLLSLIDEPSSGKIKINEKSIDFTEKKTNDKIRAKEIGIIYQDKNLLTDFTALENVYLARLNALSNKSYALSDSKKIISKVGLSNRMNHFPSQLSGGESQRIAICRALVNSPNIILADEPTGNLDYKNAKEIFKMFISLKNKDRILIFATHNRYFANKADCKIELLDGKIKVANVRN